MENPGKWPLIDAFIWFEKILKISFEWVTFQFAILIFIPSYFTQNTRNLLQFSVAFKINWKLIHLLNIIFHSKIWITISISEDVISLECFAHWLPRKFLIKLMKYSNLHFVRIHSMRIWHGKAFNAKRCNIVLIWMQSQCNCKMKPLESLQLTLKWKQWMCKVCSWNNWNINMRNVCVGIQNCEFQYRANICEFMKINYFETGNVIRIYILLHFIKLYHRSTHPCTNPCSWDFNENFNFQFNFKHAQNKLNTENVCVLTERWLE